MSGISQQRREEMFHRDGYRCVYCGLPFEPDLLTVDHVEPRVKQGDHSSGNLVTACAECNRLKAGRTAWDWLKDRPTQRANFLRLAVHVWPRHRRAVEEAS